MSLVSGFPQSYHHHHHHGHVHHGHHNHVHQDTETPSTSTSSSADAVYVTSSAAYYPTSLQVRYDDSPSVVVTGNSPVDASSYYPTAWNYSNGDSPSDMASSSAVYAVNTATDYPPPSAANINDNVLQMHAMDGTYSQNNVMGGGEERASYEVPQVPIVRVVKRRCTANRKERRRTMSINNAFADLRDCIPNVPSDTKLSKIKTLRLATSYIAYLMDILAKDDPSLVPEGGFKAEVSKKIETREEKKKKEMASLLACNNQNVTNEKRSKGRTGWPQHVWALELKQ